MVVVEEGPNGELPLASVLALGVDKRGLFMALLFVTMTDIRWFNNGFGNHAPSKRQLILCFLRNSYDCLDKRVRKLLQKRLEFKHF